MLNIGYNQDFSNVNATYVNVTKYVGPKIQPKPDYAYKLISNKKNAFYLFKVAMNGIICAALKKCTSYDIKYISH